ncbi:Thioredoxin-like protein 1 [Cytospora mali]|uniref:Thioredoxin-like protein 1 n=1 Tax=Cytospora mali TaxID=578113 RepID=A0A194VDL2_CYTMA|nr:Thioredoxin-like protein 1 [Valsa mali var. pyri (nom. inval.)]
MSSTINIESSEQFRNLLRSSKIVIVDFYADWCGPCKAIAPLYEQLSAQLSKPGVVAFVKVNTEQQKDIAAAYRISSIPTFMMFRDGNKIDEVRGADPPKLKSIVEKLASEIQNVSSGGAAGSSSAGGNSALGWRGAELPRGYTDVTDQVEIQKSELLNYDGEFGNVRTLVDSSKPGALSGGKKTEKDWVVSDTDDQLLLFTPFMSMVKLHTLQITSARDEDEDVMRPRVVKLFTNRPHNLGFEDAESEAPTQLIELSEKDWNSEGTVNIPLRFVKFQNINSLVLFVESGDGDGEKTRIDRIRLIGEHGGGGSTGKLEKIGDDGA